MKLIIKSSDKTFEVVVDSNCKVKDLKVEIAKITMIPPLLQKLSLFSGAMRVRII